MVSRVFCVGLGKTGTGTFAECMTRLGFWHRTGPGAWGLLMREAGKVQPLLQLATHYDGVDDFPWPYLYRELAETFPDARFVLTRRQDPETWYASLCNHYDRAGPSLELRKAYGVHSPHEARNELIALYEQHNRAVADCLGRTGRLLELCWDAGDGWEKLCHFLDIDVPDEVFPHRNASREKDLQRNLERLVRKGKLEHAEYLCDLHATERPDLRDRFLELLEPSDLSAPRRARLRHWIKGKKWVKG